EIGDLAESEEGKSDRQRDIEMRQGDGKGRAEGVEKEIGGFEVTEERQVRGNRGIQQPGAGGGGALAGTCDGTGNGGVGGGRGGREEDASPSEQPIEQQRSQREKKESVTTSAATLEEESANKHAREEHEEELVAIELHDDPLTRLVRCIRGCVRL